ncbi:MAG: cupin protein [Chitinophagaceae bacterium]|nr:cupin protein [Chitinophagaceae bacterium]
MEFSISKNPQIIKQLLKDDGQFPNSNLPVLIYKAALTLPEEHAATIIEDIFKKNNWTNSWRNGIYDYHHYHSITHEVLGVYEGNTTVELGGAKGITLLIEKGDVIIIPAGVAHRNVTPESNFKCVGAYPGGSDYDIKKGEPGDRPEADKNIKKVPLPENDPVYNTNSSLKNNWM